VKIFRLTAGMVLAAIVAFTALANLAVFAPHLEILRIALTLPWLFILPGALILSLLKLSAQTQWEKLSLSVGFSLLAVMLGALLINTTLPLFGQAHPLAVANLMPGLSVIWLLLGGIWWWAHRREHFNVHLPAFKPGTLAVGFTGLFIVLFAVSGAISLNNGGTGLITLFMLILTGVYLSVLVWKRHQLSEDTITAAIYCVGLALLLMMSLRGWSTAGHDVQREFRVFMLTLGNLHWSPAAYHDAYNACLSITLLPTVIKQILGIDPTFVYKTVFQALFAFVPVVTYLIARRFTSRLVALLSAIYFVAFPTYFQDMPMLNPRKSPSSSWG
jgi:uncharacterized membrane protein